MLFRIAVSCASALMFYILYYVCHLVLAFCLPQLGVVILTVIGSALFIGAVLVIHRVQKKSTPEEVRLTKLSLKEIGMLFLLGVAFNIFCTVVIAFIPFPKEMVENYAEASSELSSVHVVWTAVLTLIIAPITEEFLYRGLFYNNLRKAMHPIIAAFISGTLFGLAHSSPIWILYAAFFGFVLALVYEKYSSLTASVLFHFGFNTFGFISGEISLSGHTILNLFVPCTIYIAYMIDRIIRMPKASVHLQTHKAK